MLQEPCREAEPEQWAPAGVPKERRDGKKSAKLPETPKTAEEMWQHSVIGDYLAKYRVSSWFRFIPTLLVPVLPVTLARHVTGCRVTAERLRRGWRRPGSRWKRRRRFRGSRKQRRTRNVMRFSTFSPSHAPHTADPASCLGHSSMFANRFVMCFPQFLLWRQPELGVCSVLY